MIVTLCGPSCAGKTTLESMLKDSGFKNIVSCTTRAMRPGEVNGKDYYFMEIGDFMLMEKAGCFVETNSFGDNYYGVSVQEITRLAESGSPVVVVCEPVGMKNLVRYCKEKGWPVFTVFINNPECVIRSRLATRIRNEITKAGDDGEVIGKVMSYANRIREMQTTEKTWVHEATTCNLYDLVVSEFNAENCFGVAKTITGLLNAEAVI